MGAMSRRKGASGERELAALAQEAGFPSAKRTAPMQAGGYANEFGDVEIPLLYAEDKRYRRTPVARHLRTLLHEEHLGQTSVLFWRDNGEPWRCALDAVEFLNRHRELLDLRSEVIRLRATVRAMTPGLEHARILGALARNDDDRDPVPQVQGKVEGQPA